MLLLRSESFSLSQSLPTNNLIPSASVLYPYVQTVSNNIDFLSVPCFSGSIFGTYVNSTMPAKNTWSDVSGASMTIPAKVGDILHFSVATHTKNLCNIRYNLSIGNNTFTYAEKNFSHTVTRTGTHTLTAQHSSKLGTGFFGGILRSMIVCDVYSNDFLTGSTL